MRWRFIHIPKTGGSSFAATFGRSNYNSNTPHALASHFPDAKLLFSLVRHPFRRALSICAYLHRKQALEPATFHQWLENGLPCGIVEGGGPITMPQVAWLNTPLRFHICAPLESHRLQLRSFCRLAKLRERGLPVNNQSSYAAPLADYFTPAARDILADKYAEDFKRFRLYTPDTFETLNDAELHRRQRAAMAHRD